MQIIKKQYKELYKYYKKQLTKIQKDNLNYPATDLDYFITYLKFIRDYFILTEPLTINDEENPKIISIILAIDAYTNYKNCWTKYYKLNERGVIVKKLADTEEEVLQKYNKEKSDYWTIFTELTSINIESWVDNSATI